MNSTTQSHFRQKKHFIRFSSSRLPPPISGVYLTPGEIVGVPEWRRQLYVNYIWKAFQQTLPRRYMMEQCVSRLHTKCIRHREVSNNFSKPRTITLDCRSTAPAWTTTMSKIMIRSGVGNRDFALKRIDISRFPHFRWRHTCLWQKDTKHKALTKPALSEMHVRVVIILIITFLFLRYELRVLTDLIKASKNCFLLLFFRKISLQSTYIQWRLNTGLKIIIIIK